MAAPPAFLKKASKRRLDAALPLPHKPAAQNKVATFRNPGNKAGAGLLQKVEGKEQGTDAETGSEDNAETGSYLSKLKAASPKKKKTKVQPAVNRKLAAMKMASMMSGPSTPMIGGPPQ